jgi:hypothetical protein
MVLVLREPSQVATTNHLLAALPSIVGRTLTLTMKRHLLNKDQTLFDVREPIRSVYFPINASFHY